MKQHEEIETLKQQREATKKIDTEGRASVNERFGRNINAAHQKHKIETKIFDKRIYTDIIQKVCDQQDMLQRAGICGFQITDDVKEIKFQMDLIQSLQKFHKTRS